MISKEFGKIINFKFKNLKFIVTKHYCVSLSLVIVAHALEVYSPTLTYAGMLTHTKVAARKHFKDISCEVHELHYIKFN